MTDVFTVVATLDSRRVKQVDLALFLVQLESAGPDDIPVGRWTEIGYTQHHPYLAVG